MTTPPTNDWDSLYVDFRGRNTWCELRTNRELRINRNRHIRFECHDPADDSWIPIDLDRDQVEELIKQLTSWLEETRP